MDKSPSLFSTESLSVALPGYRWVEFVTHKAEQPLPIATSRQVLEKLVTDPAFVNEYLSFALVQDDQQLEVVHGPYLVAKIGPEHFVEGSMYQVPNPILHAVLHGTGVYEGSAPALSEESLERINSHLAKIPKDSSYFYLNLNPTTNEEMLSEIGGIFVEYSQHFFVPSTMDSIHVVTIACE